MKLDHLVILVADLQVSLPFYETLLSLIGFHKDREHVFGNADGVYLDIKQASEPEHGYRRYAPGLNHIGFTAPSRAALVDIRQRMSEAGFDVPEIQQLGSESALFFRDPDGMRVELTVYGDGAIKPA